MWPDYVEVFPFYTHFVCFNGYCILSNVLASIDMIEDMGQNRTRVALYVFPGDCGYLTAATTLYTVSPFLSLGSASVCTSYSGPLVC